MVCQIYDRMKCSTDSEQGVSTTQPEQTELTAISQPIQSVQTGAAVQEPPKYGPTGLVQRILSISRKLKAENKLPDKPTPDLFILDVPHEISAQELYVFAQIVMYHF